LAVAGPAEGDRVEREEICCRIKRVNCLGVERRADGQNGSYSGKRGPGA
jgi:hypothetical protein